MGRSPQPELTFILLVKAAGEESATLLKEREGRIVELELTVAKLEADNAGLVVGEDLIMWGML